MWAKRHLEGHSLEWVEFSITDEGMDSSWRDDHHLIKLQLAGRGREGA